MAADDWFRSADWNAEAQDLFRKKMARARDQKWFYQKVKAGAISAEYPEEALALYQEILDAHPDPDPGILYSMAQVHWRQGRVELLFDYLDRAMGSAGMGLQAMGVMENAFISALFGRTSRYERAASLFEPLDSAAQQCLGRPFARSFAGAFGEAIIRDALGQKNAAKEAALIALEWTRKTEGPLPGYPQVGLPPAVPQPWLDRMIVIAGLWQESEMGPPPEKRPLAS